MLVDRILFSWPYKGYVTVEVISLLFCQQRLKLKLRYRVLTYCVHLDL